MVKLIHPRYRAAIWAAEERVEKYKAAGYVPAVALETEKSKSKPKAKKKKK